jgi:hypothetical protein
MGNDTVYEEVKMHAHNHGRVMKHVILDEGGEKNRGGHPRLNNKGHSVVERMPHTNTKHKDNKEVVGGDGRRRTTGGEKCLRSLMESSH